MRRIATPLLMLAASAVALIALTACSGQAPGPAPGGSSTSGNASSSPTTKAPTASGTATSMPGSTGASTITLRNKAFDPATLKVNAGDTVTIMNADQVPHHIVVGTDDLGEQAPGESKTWKAPKDGVYALKCLIHPEMRGEITVGAGGSRVETPAGGGTLTSPGAGSSTGSGTGGSTGSGTGGSGSTGGY
jgi:plastocyanin